jgi:phenylalanyl-tRNA synthetase beta chain
VLAGDIEKVFDANGGEYMESYKLFDLYEGDQIEAGKKSMAYSIVFRAKDRNLEDNDVNTAMDKIMKGLNDLGVVLRS